MVNEDLVWTFKPDGKKGIQMPRKSYEGLANYILNAIDNQDQLTLNALLETAQQEIADSLDGDVAWYVLQVKLDLEARDFIRQVPSSFNKRLFLLKITRQGQRKLWSQLPVHTTGNKDSL